MSLLQSISDFLESIFKRSSPEVQKKQLMKRLEAELKNFEPPIYQNGNLLPNFAEALNSLYRNTTPLDNLFLTTVSNSDIPRQHRFEAQLIITGYSPADQSALESLTYESRKQEILGEIDAPERVYMRQRKLLERLLKELNAENFKMMDRDILNLRQFVDFCHVGFLPLLQIFDVNYQAGNSSYQPNFSEVPISKAVNVLEDIYYQSAGLKITTTTADQVVALAQLKRGNTLSNQETSLYVTNLKKINYVLTKVLTQDRLKTLIRLAKQNINAEPEVASYTGSPRQEFANMMQSRYEAEEQRIKTELQDERIGSEVSELFKNSELLNFRGYNSEFNFVLQSNTPFSFQWILPIRVLKTFLSVYMSEGIKSLLNDIVIEGFFNNAQYKTNFSQAIYSVINADKLLEEFEESFGEAKRNSIGVMQSYLKDSHKDKDFYKKLERMVIDANNEAHKILQSICSTLCYVYKSVDELIADAKKPSSEIIDNIKVLMTSSRNMENTNLLEKQHTDWHLFFEIMKNYVIINLGESQS